MTKQEFVIILLFIFSLFPGFGQANAGSSGPADTVTSYFEASRNGDVNIMKTLMAGSFYEHRKVLLTNNKDYPEFLKKYYQGVRIAIVSSSIGGIDMVANNYPKLYERYRRKGGDATAVGINGVAVVTVSREFSDGRISNTEYLLKKDEQDNWKIYEQLLDQ